MTRPLRIGFPGALYHVTSRGNARQAIFLDEEDKSKFLEVLLIVVGRFNWLCHAYCLMENHIMIETPEGNLSRGMRHLNGVFTQGFNQRHRRVGHLFQGRYKAIVVEKERHLLSLCRYVVLNPVRAGLVKRPERWVWSSYRATVGEVKRPRFLTVRWILSQFEGRKREERYKEFVLAGMKEDNPWKDLKGQILLGAEEFIGKLERLLKEKEDIKEVPRIQRYAGRRALDELFGKGRAQESRMKRFMLLTAMMVIR